MKNEWLRSIIGDAYTEKMDEDVAKHLGTNFVTKSDFNAKLEEVKGLKTSLTERDNQLTALKALKPEEMQAKITQLEQANSTAAAKFQQDLNAAKIDLGVEAALDKAGAVNTKALKALMDLSKLSLNPDGTVFGLSEQVANLQKTEKWGFTAPVITRTHLPGQKTPEDYATDDSKEAPVNNMMNALIRGTSINQEIGGE